MLITITGLPRSGTAFLSMLCQLHPDCLSYHELAAFDTDWKNTILNSEADIVCDCNTYGYLRQAELPSDKRVYITSHPSQAHRSSEIACKKKIDPQLLINLNRIGEKWALEKGAYVIDRKKVFTLEGCREIWLYCFDDYFPVEKVEAMLRLNIQQHQPDVICADGKKFVL